MQSLRHLATLDSCSTLPPSLCLRGHKCNIPPHFSRRPRRGHSHLYPPRRQQQRYLLSQALGDSTSNQNQATFEAVDGLLKSLVRFNRKRASLHQLDRLRQLVVLLQKNPEAAGDAWKVGLVPTLEELQACGQAEVEQQARLALSLLGHAPVVPGRGIRILSVDGGGTRWVSGYHLQSSVEYHFPLPSCPSSSHLPSFSLLPFLLFPCPSSSHLSSSPPCPPLPFPLPLPLALPLLLPLAPPPSSPGAWSPS